MDKQPNNNYIRRQFIGMVLAGTGALMAGPGLPQVQAGRRSRSGRKVTDVVTKITAVFRTRNESRELERIGRFTPVA